MAEVAPAAWGSHCEASPREASQGAQKTGALSQALRCVAALTDRKVGETLDLALFFLKDLDMSCGPGKKRVDRAVLVVASDNLSQSSSRHVGFEGQKIALVDAMV